MKFGNCRVVRLWAALTVGALAPSAVGQPTDSSPGQGASTISGTVVSTAKSTLLVRTAGGGYHLFAFDRYTFKPKVIPIGSTVKVLSTPSSEPAYRVATDVIVTDASSQAPATDPSEPVPVSVRQLESDIERQSHRFGMGFRAGVALDPELILLGVHAKFGPFFHHVSFRPNFEFGWGEVTKQFTLNLDGVFRLPFSPQSGRWSVYAGAGPSFGFSHQDFEQADAGNGGIDFSDFDYKGGLNILGGRRVSKRNVL